MNIKKQSFSLGNKTILISIVLLAVFAYSAYAGCCVLKSSPPIYWDFSSWSSQTTFCNNLGTVLSLNSSWYNETCIVSQQNLTKISSDAKNGWTSPTPITPPAGGGGSGGGGGGSTPACEEVSYNCDSWSTCTNGRQSRTCTRRTVCGNVPTSQTVLESRSCTSTVETLETTTGGETVTSEEGSAETNVNEEVGGLGGITGGAVTDVSGEGAFSKITGAVTGAIGNAPWAYAITFVFVIGGLLTGVYFFKPKKKKIKVSKE